MKRKNATEQSVDKKYYTINFFVVKYIKEVLREFLLIKRLITVKQGNLSRI